MSVLLIITTGRTDIQLVTGEVRHEFVTKCARLHDELERRANEWNVVDVPVQKSGSIDALPTGSFQICTPKLDAVLQYVSESGLRLSHALVLDTQRTVADDPRYAGAVLERRLRERTDAVVWRAPFLRGVEWLGDIRTPRDEIVRREVVSRIEGAVRDAIRDSACHTLVLANTGGMSNITTLVEEVVQLHAWSSVVYDPIEVPDGAKANPPVPDRAVPRRSGPEPAESFRARRHALELIERGNFLAAWGAVRHLHTDELERGWTRIVEWLSLFAASLPLPADCDIPILRHPYMAVRSAIGVDLALRSDDIPRAVHGTVAFFESALWDHLLNPHLTRHPKQNRLYRADPAPTADLIRTNDPGDEENRKRPFDLVRSDDGIQWYKVFDDDVCGIRLAKRYLNNDNLTVLGQAASGIRQLRNDVAHNVPTPELMATARQKMADAKLWPILQENGVQFQIQDGSDQTKGPFLTQPLIQNVLRDLGEQDPGGLCARLIDVVKTRLRA